MQGYNHPFIPSRIHIPEQKFQAVKLPMEDMHFRHRLELKFSPLPTVKKLFTNQDDYASA